MANSVTDFIQHHRRLIARTMLVVVTAGVVVGVFRWQSNGSGPVEVVTSITSQCRLDPARIPDPPGGTANYLHTCGNQIYDSHGNLVQIAGVSWFGLETANMSPDGLWARNWQTILDQLATLGYNVIRLPFSDDILRPGARPSGINYLLNPDLPGLTSLQVLDKVIAGAHQRGLRVLLDRHRPTSAGQSDLWYTPQVPESTWIADWTFLAKRYQNDDSVIGADLDNEPRANATWGSNDSATDWRLAAQRAGNAILAVNPHWLILVEGIEHTGQDWYWWGGDLEGVAAAPVIVNVTNRVVYSPHDYGPEVYPQGWFKDPHFPDNLPSVWDTHWGFIAEQGIAPVVLGEFGGKSVGIDAEGQWQRALVDYVHRHNIGYISWALNPDSGDTGGILQDDWLTVQSSKLSLYSPGDAPKIAPARPGQTTSGPPLRLTYHAGDAASGGPNASFVVTLFNDQSSPLQLSHVSLRYWLANATTTETVVDWAALGDGHVKATVVSSPCGNQGGYVAVTFDDGSGPLAGYGTTGPILIRYHNADWSSIDPERDYSHPTSTADQPATKMQVFLDGKLLWGNSLPCSIARAIIVAH
jgi:endoglucanase